MKTNCVRNAKNVKNVSYVKSPIRAKNVRMNSDAKNASCSVSLSEAFDFPSLSLKNVISTVKMPEIRCILLRQIFPFGLAGLHIPAAFSCIPFQPAVVAVLG